VGRRGNFRSIRCELALETELSPKLNEARVVHRVVYLTKAKCPDVVDRQAETAPWLNRLKNSALKFRPIFSQGSVNA